MIFAFVKIEYEGKASSSLSRRRKGRRRRTRRGRRGGRRADIEGISSRFVIVIIERADFSQFVLLWQGVLQVVEKIPGIAIQNYVTGVHNFITQPRPVAKGSFNVRIGDHTKRKRPGRGRSC